MNTAQKMMYCNSNSTYAICIHICIQCYHNMAKGGVLSEKSGGFLLLPNLQKNIPFYYPKLLHPVYGIDKMSILKKFTFTCLSIYRFKK